MDQTGYLGLNDWEFAEQPGATWRPIAVPAAWEAQGYGLELIGPVSYRCRLSIPADWQGRQIALECAGVSYACEVLLDRRPVGSHEGMWDAFELDLTPYVQAGGSYELQLLVEKQGRRYPLRETPVGFLPDLGISFGGIWQPIGVRARGGGKIAALQIMTRMHAPQLRLNCELQLPDAGADLQRWRLRVVLSDAQSSLLATHELRAAPGLNLIALELPAVQLWEPEQPYRYTLRVELLDGEQLADALQRKVGIRELAIQGTQILLNGQPLYLRGVLGWGFWPEQFAPDPDAQTLRMEWLRLREMGFNLIKHCLYVPPRWQIELGDELGFLSWLELPIWIPQMSAEMRSRILQQLPRIAAQRQGHPSLLITTLGCEMNSSVDAPLLAELFQAVRQAMPDVLLRDNSGSGECYGGLASDFADFYDYHFYADLQFYPALIDAFAAGWRPQRPWLFGEFNDIDAFRERGEILRGLLARSGNPAPPWWLEPERDWSACPHIQQPALPIAHQQRLLAEQQVLEHPEQLRINSNETARIVRKAVLERVRSYPQLAGYVVTGLRDTPIASAGLFDDLGRARIEPAELRRFNADCVLCLMWDLRRSWLHGGDRLRRSDVWNYVPGDTIRPHLLLSNYGRRRIAGRFSWRLSDAAGQILASGSGPCQAPVEPGMVQEIGMFELTAPAVRRPERLQLQVWLADHDAPEQAVIENSWPLWVAPPPQLQRISLGLYGWGELAAELAQFLRLERLDQTQLRTQRLILATQFDSNLREWIAAGGSAVVLLSAADPLLPSVGLPFWREAHKQFHEHAAWAGFTRELVAGMQVAALATERALEPQRLARVLKLDQPAAYQPLLRRTDMRNYRQHDYAALISSGRGQAILSTLRPQGGLGDSPSGIQHSRAGQLLLYSWLRWLEKNSR